MPSSTDHRRLEIGLAVLSVLVFGYSLIIVQQILLGVLIITVFWGAYLFYRLIEILARIASALEQLAVQRTDGGLTGEFVEEYRSEDTDSDGRPNHDD